MQDNCGKISGKQRQILGKSSDTMKSPLKVGESLYFEAHYDTESLLNIMMHRVLDVVGYDYSKIKVSIRSEWTKPQLSTKQHRSVKLWHYMRLQTRFAISLHLHSS